MAWPRPHPIRGPELRGVARAAARLPRHSLFVRHRAQGTHDAGDGPQDHHARRRAREVPLPDPSAHAASLGRLQVRQPRARTHSIDPAVPRASEHYAHGAIYGIESRIDSRISGKIDGLRRRCTKTPKAFGLKRLCFERELAPAQWFVVDFERRGLIWLRR
jgi:hypothetical protein